MNRSPAVALTTNLTAALAVAPTAQDDADDLYAMQERIEMAEHRKARHQRRTPVLYHTVEHFLTAGAIAAKRAA